MIYKCRFKFYFAAIPGIPFKNCVNKSFRGERCPSTIVHMGVTSLDTLCDVLHRVETMT